jgi:small subunit ribosomal protein S36
VWAVTVVFALLLALWSTLAPLGQAPDEPVHADIVDLIARGHSYPDFNQRHTSTAIIAAFLDYTPALSGRWLTPESAPPRSHRKTFAEFGGAKPSPFINQIPQHPPLYYWLTGFALRVERAVAPGPPAPLDREWNVMRLMNVAMVVWLPLLTWLAARRLGTTAPIATSAAIVPLTIPALVHVGGSINNDNLLIVLSAVVAALVAGVLRSDGRRTVAVLLGVFAGLAFLTKALAPALLLWIPLAYGYQIWRDRSRWRRSVECIAIAEILALLIGGWWPVRNALRGYGFFPTVLGGFLLRSDTKQYQGNYWQFFWSRLVERFWFDGGMTLLVVGIATALALTAIVLAFVRKPDGVRSGSDGGPTRGQLAVFGSVFLIMLTGIAYNAYSAHSRRGTIAGIQGRYLFVAVVPFAVVVATGTARVLGRWAPVAMFGAALVMQVDAARVSLRKWWAEPNASLRRSVSAMIHWSPWPSLLTYAVGVTLAVSVIATALLLVRSARSPLKSSPTIEKVLEAQPTSLSR